MFKTFKDYLCEIYYKYVMISVFYKAYLEDESKKGDYIAIKRNALKDLHHAYRKISPKRFKKHGVQCVEKAQYLFEIGAFNLQEYEIEKWIMDYCKKYPRNYHKLTITVSDDNDEF